MLIEGVIYYRNNNIFDKFFKVVCVIRLYYDNLIIIYLSKDFFDLFGYDV